MTPTIYRGDVMAALHLVPDNSVQCVVTSPPYWGLRDYGTAKWEGGDPACNHRPPDEAGQTEKPTAGQREHPGRFSGPTCWRCGARRIDAQIGLEPTPDAYVAKMVEVFREVRRVLRKDGVCWVNLGDSYAGSTTGNTKSGLAALSERCDGNRRNGDNWATVCGDMHGFTRPDACACGLKPKDLVGIPWRVACALQADGWWLRQDIIWHKPNPMPESVRDRCTKAHEYIFLLTKSTRCYYDATAIAEPAVVGFNGSSFTSASDLATRANVSLKPRAEKPTRNRRSVWTITPKPYREAHFATFPPEIPRLCISAGSRPGDTVLDPFAGSGTTGMVALELGRVPLLVELKAEYCEMTQTRCGGRLRLYSLDTAPVCD